MILVTGGTGLVGSHLLLQLVKKGQRIRAIHRASSNLNAVLKVFSYYEDNANEFFDQIEWVIADINDIPALEVAFNGVRKVYHAAAFISFDPSDFDTLMKINQEGTANIVNLCITHSVDKLCYVSSIATLGKGMLNDPVDEESEFNLQQANVYAKSKYEAELEVWRGAQEGISVVVLNPGVIIGPGFWEDGTGRLFTTAAKGHRCYPPGGTGFITVTDVVRMMTTLMDSEVKSERFVAVAANRSYLEILQYFSKELDVKAPTVQLQIWQLQLLRVFDALYSFFTGRARRLTKTSIISLKNRTYYNNSKAVVKLDFVFETLQNTIAFSCAKFKEENR